jgi:Protein of unknown function (DUF998)
MQWRTAVRPAAVWTLGVAGLAAYNWWVLAPFKPGLMRSPDEMFSNLEVTGQPYAAVMQHADMLAGVLLLCALLAAGVASIPGARREWLAMTVFAAAGIVGGLFPQVCEDGINAACMSSEWRFRLPASQYVHDGAGGVEFAAITLALLLAVRRTRGDQTGAARVYRNLLAAAAVAYPLLGLAYLTDRLGSVAEGAFFAGFTVMVMTHLAERTTARRVGAAADGGFLRDGQGAVFSAPGWVSPTHAARGAGDADASETGCPGLLRR